jgi:hypothetical protein
MGGEGLHRSARVIRLAGSLALLVPLLGHSSAARAESAKEADALESFLAQYEAIRSVHLRAVAVLERTPAGQPTSVAQGEVEYWEQGSSYRNRCTTRGDVRLLDDVDVAFDGTTFRYFVPRMNSLFYLAGDSENSPVALPNPLFLPVEAVVEKDPGCRYCRASLARVAASRSRLASRIERTTRGTSGQSVYELLPDADGRGEFRSRLEMSSVEGQPVPGVVERLSLAGEPESRTEFSDWVEVDASGFLVPKRIAITDFGPDGAVTLRMTFQVTAVEVDQPLESELFHPTIGEDTAILDASQVVHPEIPALAE